MQRINNIIPSVANPQPTQAIATINVLATNIAPEHVANAIPTVTLPMVQPVRSPASVSLRPQTTPVLAGGRTPIPVQIPRVLPPISPGQIPRVLPPISSAQIPPVLPAINTGIRMIPIMQVPVIRSAINSPNNLTRPLIARPPLSPFTTASSVSVVQRMLPSTTASQLIIRAPTIATIPVMPPMGYQAIPTKGYKQTLTIPTQITERPLGAWQLEWFGRIRRILGQNYGYIDTSQPGAGKTSVALWIAKLFNLPVLVIAPAGIVDAGVWPREAQRVNAQNLIIDVLSYNMLAGKKFHQPNNPYLTSIDHITEGGIVQTRFDATQYYKNITARGCLLIFDEFSNLKNTSRKLKASLEMLANVIIEGGPSRYALLSGTPFDKEGHAVNILRALRYIRAPRLYYKDPSTKEVSLEGLHELIEACRLMNEPATELVLSRYNIDDMSTGMSQTIVYHLYTSVIKQTISGSMRSPPTEGNYELFNGFFNINPIDLTQLKRGINDLARALKFDPHTGLINASKNSFGQVTPALRIIEFAKIRDMLRFARNSLQNSPKLKVILVANYTETIDSLMNGLADYGPIQFDGRTKKKQRALIEDLFRDSPYHRVLVGNLIVIAKGLSFQSFNAEDSRMTIISPSYHMLDISQAAYRTDRAGKKGDASVYIFYGQGNGIEMETKILQAMLDKSGVVKGTLDDNGNELKLPGEYELYHEPL